MNVITVAQTDLAIRIVAAVCPSCCLSHFIEGSDFRLPYELSSGVTAVAGWRVRPGGSIVESPQKGAS